MAQPPFSAEVKSRVPAELKQRLELIAEERELDLSDIVREALRQYVRRVHQEPAATAVAEPAISA